MDIYTGVLSAPLTIVKEDNVFQLSVIAVGGTVTFLGNRPFKNLTLSPVTLQNGQSVVVQAAPSAGLAATIQNGTGVAAVAIFF